MGKCADCFYWRKTFPFSISSTEYHEKYAYCMQKQRYFLNGTTILEPRPAVDRNPFQQRLTAAPLQVNIRGYGYGNQELVPTPFNPEACSDFLAFDKTITILTTPSPPIETGDREGWGTDSEG
jgi:hypothetical protein